jgi:hypothetical protein
MASRGKGEPITAGDSLGEAEGGDEDAGGSSSSSSFSTKVWSSFFIEEVIRLLTVTYDGEATQS